jgi:hypothetical protein
MLDKLSAKISEFGHNVLLHYELGTKSHKKRGFAGMVCGLTGVGRKISDKKLKN